MASAKRFYEEIRPFVTENAGFSNSTGPARYALAWLEGDEAMERRAMEDSATDSYNDLHLQIVDAILHGKYEDAGRLLDASTERYGNRRDSLLKAYLALIPALLDGKHAEHGKAIESFPGDDRWLFLRWGLAQQAKLPTDEVVRLFHHKTAGPEGIFAAAAQADKERFRALYVKVALDPMERVLIAHEFLKQEGTPTPKPQPDLKPAGARPIQELVRDELRK